MNIHADRLHSSCGACVHKCYSCFISVAEPLVALICVSEVALAILVFTNVPDEGIKNLATQASCGGSDSRIELNLELEGDWGLLGDGANIVRQINENKKVVAYVLFLLAVLQLLRLLAGRYVRCISMAKEEVGPQNW
jgi:hypothetical protein